MNIKVDFIPTQAMMKKRGLDPAGKVQMYLDSEVLRMSDPYVPFLTGNLKRSGQLGTVIGSGLVQYNAIYAHEQYYHNAGRGKQGLTKKNSHNVHCIRGKLWFERMKADHLQDLIEKVAEKAGGRRRY